MRTLLALLLAVPLHAELRLELVRESLTGVHCRYREYVEGIPSERYVTRACSEGTVAPPARIPRFTRDDTGRVLRREIRFERPLEPFAYEYDATTGALVRRIPLFFHAKAARVFDPNPVAALNNTALQDQNDSATAVPEAAYESVDLDNVADSGPLRGPHVALVDRQSPNIPPPDASGSLLFNRADDGFEDVNAYFHIDRTQRYLQSLGYAGSRAIAPYAIETDAHAQGGLDNSVFLPSSSQPGRGTLFFGEGGTDDAEDADLVVHEYGHAILEWIAPGTFGGTFASEARALSEGFGDYWAFSSHYAQRVASGRDPYCFADWDARCWTDDPSQQCAYPPNTDCLRRLDSTRTMAGYERGDTGGVEHRNGQIWSSALREIFLTAGRHVTDLLVLESLFGAPPRPTFAVMARRMADVDRQLFGGRHVATICSAMSARGIVEPGSCEPLPRGELTHFQSGDRGIAIPENNPDGIVARLTINDPRAIEQIHVRVDIAHPSRGDLRITLVAPDGTSVLLQQASFERTRDVHVTFGLDADPAEPLSILHGRPANGVWELRVADIRARDAGTLLSWGLVLQLAGDRPETERPRHAVTQMIPVVAHVYGQGITPFLSDVRITNPGSTTRTATLIFTRSGEDGTHSFAAIDVHLEPGHTAAFEDVLASAFNTTGSGSLEVLGDVVVLSRVYTPLPTGGTAGERVPTRLATTGPLYVAAMPMEEGRSRVNVGIVELQGRRRTIHVTGLSRVTVSLEPYSHVQIAAPPGEVLEIGGGEGGIHAYLSQVDNVTGDAMFIPAVSADPDAIASGFVPYVRTSGIGGSAWSTDLWLGSYDDTPPLAVRVASPRQQFVFTPFVVPPRGQAIAYPDFVGRQIDAIDTAGLLSYIRRPGLFVGTRITNRGMSQFVQLLGGVEAPAQRTTFVESSDAYRTNIGLATLAGAVAEVIVRDSAGRELERHLLGTNTGIVQVPVTARVLNGSATVRYLLGDGRVYASIIDNVSGDAMLVPDR